MKKLLTTTIALAFGLGLTASAFAEGQAAPQPVATGATSVPTPAISTVEGAISSLDVASATPWIKVKDAAGKESTLMIDPATSTVWKAGQKVAWTDLKVADKLKVRYTMKGDKEMVKTAEIE